MFVSKVFATSLVSSVSAELSPASKVTKMVFYSAQQSDYIEEISKKASSAKNQFGHKQLCKQDFTIY